MKKDLDSYRVGVVIGRFQVPNLTPGHLHILNIATQNNDEVLVLIGTTRISATRRNPLDYPTIKAMLTNEFSNAVIKGIFDTGNDDTWSEHVDETILKTFQNIDLKNDVILYGGRKSFIPHYHGKCQTFEIESIDVPTGTDFREEVLNTTIDSENFRRGMIYQMHKLYPSVMPTVDIAVVDDMLNPKKILLGRKPNDVKGKYRLPGGFVEPSDGTFENAAIKEVREETNCVISNLRYIGTYLSGDWRYVNEIDKIITTLFIAEYSNGIAKAGDDLEEVKWFDIDELTKDAYEKGFDFIVNGHKSLIVEFLKLIGK